ncbi:MAG: tRNA (adenosine(37)-N6)-threonylcarbamoyltransferase complex ATPase subunit type 1 TsaE [Bacteroidota bacterium]
MLITITSIDQIQKAAKEFLKTFRDYHFFSFYGEMGAGKTTFIKALCKELNVTDQVNSPTFSIVHEYLTDDKKKIYHFDFFRINKPEEIVNIGFGEYFHDADYVFIEWPEIAEKIFDDDFIKIRISVPNDQIRTIEMIACP